MKKRVLHIVEAFGGGVFTYLIALANATCEEFDVVIAYTRRPQTPDDFQKLLDQRVTLIEMKKVKRKINLMKDIRGAIEIRSIYKVIKPDFVHLHSSKAGFLGRMVIDCKRNHVAYTPHGYAFLKKDDSRFVRNIYKTVEKVAARKGGQVVGVSEGEYTESLAITKKATYVSNGIDVSDLAKLPIKEDISCQKKRLYIGTVGRICYQKNPAVFNEIAKKLPNDLFLWIGDGTMYDELKGDNIAVSSWLEQAQAMEILNKLDIFILPSLWEGLPISLLEAMYLKKVCIVSDVIGNRDVIKHGVNGFIANTADEYVTVIEEIRSGKWPIEEIVENARKDVVETYNIDVMCKKYTELYRHAGEKK